METIISRTDTGLDFKRIENIISMFQAKTSKKIESVRREKNSDVKKREQEAFTHFGIQSEIQAIQDIDSQIEELKKSKKVHEDRVRDFTQGTESNNRYNTFDSIREGSPIHRYSHENVTSYSNKEKHLNDLKEAIVEELWLAKDIGQAADIYSHYMSLLEQSI